MINVKELKEKYPNPVTFVSGDGYCVGGALCLELSNVRNFPVPEFPSSKYLRDALIIANPNLPFDEAQEYANLIIDHNDDGKFKAAWKALERALEYKKTLKENQNG